MTCKTVVGAVLSFALICSSCGGSAGGGASDQRVRVTIRNSRFVPDHFDFKLGTTVTFVVENTDPIDHEFLIGDAVAQQAHEDGTEAHHGAKPGELSIPLGETRSTTFTFDRPGTILIGCHLPTHYAFGMRGDITIDE